MPKNNPLRIRHEHKTSIRKQQKASKPGFVNALLICFTSSCNRADCSEVELFFCQVGFGIGS